MSEHKIGPVDRHHIEQHEWERSAGEVEAARQRQEEIDMAEAERARQAGKEPTAKSNYAGWHITVTVMADELGDMTGCDEAATYARFREQYQEALERYYPGAEVTVRQSGNIGIRSASERPSISGYKLPSGETDTDNAMMSYEEECLEVQAVGESVFDAAGFWVEAS